MNFVVWHLFFRTWYCLQKPATEQCTALMSFHFVWRIFHPTKQPSMGEKLSLTMIKRTLLTLIKPFLSTAHGRISFHWCEREGERGSEFNFPQETVYQNPLGEVCKRKNGAVSSFCFQWPLCVFQEISYTFFLCYLKFIPNKYSLQVLRKVKWFTRTNKHDYPSMFFPPRKIHTRWSILNSSRACCKHA